MGWTAVNHTIIRIRDPVLQLSLF